MVQFAKSEHNRKMAAYEKACGEAKASNPSARARLHGSIEDQLVAGGIDAIDEYEKSLDRKWEKASCLAEYDGLSIGYRIVRDARQRLQNQGVEQCS